MKTREIKYKSLYRNVWYEVQEAYLENGNIYPERFKGEFFSVDTEHVKCTVQYTGLKDKNGKEIYEGDIFRYILPANSVDDIETTYTEEVHFIQGCFELDNCPLGAFNDYGIVIGNIHSNPELLTK